MAVRTIDYAPTLSSDTNRGPSRAIWKDCPVSHLQERPDQGTYFFDDFTDFPPLPNTVNVVNSEVSAGPWAVFLGNNAGVKAGTSADTTNLPLEGGVLGLTAGSNNNLSISMAAPLSSFRMVRNLANDSPAGTGVAYAGGKLWFECSIAVSTVTSGTFDLFVGLMDTGDAGTRITSAADLILSAANTLKTASGNGGCIGFWKRATTNPSDVAFVHNENNGTVQNLGATTDLAKLSLNYAGGSMAALSVTNSVANTIGAAAGTCFVKLGFVFDPLVQKSSLIATALSGQTANTYKRAIVRVFVNGKDTGLFYDPAIVQATTFPGGGATAGTGGSKFMSPVIGFRTGASGAGVAYVDWIRAAQLANS